jgi:four helix bundle protein
MLARLRLAYRLAGARIRGGLAATHLARASPSHQARCRSQRARLRLRIRLGLRPRIRLAGARKRDSALAQVPTSLSQGAREGGVAVLAMAMPRSVSGIGRMTDYREPRVARLAVDFVAFCDQVEKDLRGRKSAMNGHLQEAGASLLSNIGEAFEEKSRGDRRRFFRYALRSAGECERLLHGLARVGALPPDRLAAGIRLLRDIKLDLLRLIRWAA